MIIINAKEFKSRKALEAHLQAIKEKDQEYTIKGTRRELKELKLSDTTSVFGVKCVITDTPTKDNKNLKVAELVKKGKNKVNKKINK